MAWLGAAASAAGGSGAAAGASAGAGATAAGTAAEGLGSAAGAAGAEGAGAATAAEGTAAGTAAEGTAAGTAAGATEGAAGAGTSFTDKILNAAKDKASEYMNNIKDPEYWKGQAKDFAKDKAEDEIVKSIDDDDNNIQFKPTFSGSVI